MIGVSEVKQVTAQMVTSNGTPDQIKRYWAGVLPEDEIRKLAGDALLARIDVHGFVRHRRISPEDVCPKHPSQVGWEDPAVELTAPQFDQLTIVQRLAGDLGATAYPKIHRGQCRACGRVKRRAVAVVTIRWNGRQLSREYILTGKE